MRSFCAFLLLLAMTPLHAAAPRAFDDACLRAVQFVDANEGWAVGDEGVIWHTIDGGKNWERQPTGVRGSLRGLHFVNPYTGWVVGREEMPVGSGSVGVLLFTQDGGVKWRRLLMNALPGLQAVRFVDDKVGYLAGDGNDQYPSGVFSTHDSGRTWLPVHGPRTTAWFGADFQAEGGILAGAWNRLAHVRGDRVSQADLDNLGGRNLCGVQCRAGGSFAVGQGGLVLRGTGATWGYVDLGIPREVKAAWDFHAVHGVGKHIWAVGRPGSVALHSGDDGASWQVVPTNQPLPLHGVYFQDEKLGWAVGELGSILATTDGGRNWQVQRRGGQRAAMLCVHARSTGLAVDTLARVGAEDGYFVASLRVTGPDAASAAPGRAMSSARFADAQRQVGGAASESLWQFPLGTQIARADRETLLAAWDKLHGDRAAEELLRQLVLAIRIWRPDVILTDCPVAKGSKDGPEALVAEAVQEAFRRAENPAMFREQIDLLGLAPWKAGKAYSPCDDGGKVNVSLDQTAVSKMLEMSYRDYAAPAAALLAETEAKPPAARNYRILAENMPGASSHRELMEGCNLQPGGFARRPSAVAPDSNPELERIVRKRTSLLSLCEALPTGGTSGEKLLGQMGPMLAELPDDHAAPAAHAIARQFVRQGQWDLAREAFLLMVERYPAHPLSVDAYRWLIQHNASSEARRRHEMGQFVAAQQMAFGVPNAPEEPNTSPKKAQQKAPGFSNQLIQTVAFTDSAENIRAWYQGALKLESSLSGFGSLYANDPAVQFSLQAARRNLGDYDGPKQWYTKFVARQPEGPWRNAALAELWLQNRSGSPPKPVANCREADTRPFLDGKFDEACWQSGTPLTFKNAIGDTLKDYPTEARFSYDKEFLYVALRCFHPAGRHVEPAVGRKHDADLRPFDRVSLMLDLDRDYATCFHFQFDQRGCVAEDCWGDKSWDPRWYVAIHSEATVWEIEAAIPLVALSADTPTHGKAWAFNLVRTIPAVGVQAFSLPAEVPEEMLRPEGMGLLIFSQESKQAAEMKKMPRVP